MPSIRLLPLIVAMLSVAAHAADITVAISPMPDWLEANTTPTLQAEVSNTSDEARTLTLTAVLQANSHDRSIEDDPGLTADEAVETVEQEITLPAGSKQQVELPFTGSLPVGYYRLVVVADNGGNTKQVAEGVVNVLPDELDMTGKDNRFGMNCSDPSLIPMLRRLGVSWVRFENFKWAFYNPAPGDYRYDGTVGPWNVPHDEYMQRYTEAGFRVLPYIFQCPQWASSAPESVEPRNRRMAYPPEDYADYGKAVFQTVARYGSRKHDEERLKTTDKVSGLGQIEIYELWNEANLNNPGWGFWVGDIEDYFELFRIGAEAAKRADPNARVSFAGYAGLRMHEVSRVATHTYADGKRPIDFSDIINVHYYSGKQDPETATVDPNVNRNPDAPSDQPKYEQNLAAIVTWRDDVKPEAEIWITETGYDVGGPIGLDERHQAAKIPRCMIMSFAAGVEKSFLYREKGSNPSQHAGAGLIRNDGTVRPSFLTFANMVRQFEDVPYQRVAKLKHADEDVWGYAWQRENGRTLVTVWSLSDEDELGVDLGPCTVTDAFGSTREVDDTSTLKLSIFPTYIDCEPGDTLTTLQGE